MAKDTMAAKPMVLYESDDLVAMGSEEIAIRTILPQEIDIKSKNRTAKDSKNVFKVFISTPFMMLLPIV